MRGARCRLFEKIESLSGKAGGFPVLGEGFRGLSGAAVFCYAHPQTPRGEIFVLAMPATGRKTKPYNFEKPFIQ